MLDDASPEKRIRAEAEEEPAIACTTSRKVFEAFMSPGAVTEKLHFFVAEYDAAMRIGDGGGLADEGEDIEVLELPIDRGARDDRPTAASSTPRPSCCCNTQRCICFGDTAGFCSPPVRGGGINIQISPKVPSPFLGATPKGEAKAA